MRGSATIVDCLAIIAGSVPAANAYATWYGRKLIYGVGGGTQHYWVASSASNYTGYVDQAMKNWINTSSRLGIRTPLYWTKTSVKRNSRMEIHKGYSTSDACAWVEHYTRNVRVKPYLPSGKNWVWGKVNVNSRLFSNSYRCPNPQGIISHEMGHVFGLAHVDDPSALMYAKISATSVKWATRDEARGINYLY